MITHFNIKLVSINKITNLDYDYSDSIDIQHTYLSINKENKNKNNYFKYIKNKFLKIKRFLLSI